MCGISTRINCVLLLSCQLLGCASGTRPGTSPARDGNRAPAARAGNTGGVRPGEARPANSKVVATPEDKQLLALRENRPISNDPGIIAVSANPGDLSFDLPAGRPILMRVEAESSDDVEVVVKLPGQDRTRVFRGNTGDTELGREFFQATAGSRVLFDIYAAGTDRPIVNTIERNFDNDGRYVMGYANGWARITFKWLAIGAQQQPGQIYTNFDINKSGRVVVSTRGTLQCSFNAVWLNQVMVFREILGSADPYHIERVFANSGAREGGDNPETFTMTIDPGVYVITGWTKRTRPGGGVPAEWFQFQVRNAEPPQGFKFRAEGDDGAPSTRPEPDWDDVIVLIK